MVVMVISVLFGILLSAIRTVERHTLQTVTRAEIKNIENAWKQYFAHYQMWPTNPPDNCIDARYADALRGLDAADNDSFNKDGIIFMEFTRFDSENRPANAWGESRRYNEDECAYYVMFDDDGDNRIQVPIEVPSSGGSGVSTNLARSVAVWSFNPTRRDASDRPAVLGSWQQ